MRALLKTTAIVSFACASTAAQAGGDSGTSVWKFAVMRDGDQIGTNTVQVRHNGSQTAVQIDTKVVVKVAFVPVYRFEQSETERWENGKLVAMTAVTNDNGTTRRVKATKTADKISVEADGKVTEIAGDIIPSSLWNPALLDRKRALDPQNGALVPVAVTDHGEDQLIVQGQGRKARHYSIKTTFSQDVWYDDRRQLIKVQLKGPDGSTIRYQPG